MGELFRALTEYGRSDTYAFHMPGHKRLETMGIDPYRLDITEVPGFDDLHHPEDILKRLIQSVCQVYHAKEAFLSLNGSTGGILTAISAAVQPGGAVLIARNCHRSVYNAIFLRQLRPVYIYPQIDQKLGISGTISPEDVEKQLAADPEIKAVVITSPTYEGVVSDVKAIADIVHTRGIPLIVDCAHGAHLGFHKDFPDNPLQCGADLVVMSLHKTLPAFTQTAVLCSNSDIVPAECLQQYFDIYMSSSPSYLMMCSIEHCVEVLKKPDRVFPEYIRRLKQFQNRCKELKYLYLYQPEGQSDPGKLVIAADKSSIDGVYLEQLLREKYHLQMEMCGGDYVVAMTSFCDTQEGFERFITALREIDKGLKGRNTAVCSPFQNCEAVVRYTPVEAASFKRKEIPLKKAVGSISGKIVCAYPPGIPIVAAGELITEEISEQIEQSLKSGLSMRGLRQSGNDVWIQILTEDVNG